MDNVKIGLYIKELRTKQHLTQGELADLVQVSHQAVSRWEKGDNLPDVGKLHELSVLFHISIDDIVRKGLDSSSFVERPKQQDNLIVFTILNGIIALLSIGIFYIIYYDTEKLWVPILVQYSIVLCAMLLYVLPYSQIKHKSLEAYRWFELNVYFTFLSLFVTLFIFIFETFLEASFAESLLFVIPATIGGFVLIQIGLAVLGNRLYEESYRQSFHINKYVSSILLSFGILYTIGFTTQNMSFRDIVPSPFYQALRFLIILYSAIFIYALTTKMLQSLKLYYVPFLVGVFTSSIHLIFVLLKSSNGWRDYVSLTSYSRIQDAFVGFNIASIVIYFIIVCSILIIAVKEPDVAKKILPVAIISTLFIISQECIIAFGDYEANGQLFMADRYRVYFDFSYNMFFIVFSLSLTLLFVQNTFKFFQKKSM